MSRPKGLGHGETVPGRVVTALRCPCGTGQFEAAHSSIQVALEHCLEQSRGSAVLYIEQAEISLSDAPQRDCEIRVVRG